MVRRRRKKMKMNKKLLGHIFFLIGYGIALHAIASELIKKGGIPEVLSFQGEWIGLFLVILGWLILIWEDLSIENIRFETSLE